MKTMMTNPLEKAYHCYHQHLSRSISSPPNIQHLPPKRPLSPNIQHLSPITLQYFTCYPRTSFRISEGVMVVG